MSFSPEFLSEAQKKLEEEKVRVEGELVRLTTPTASDDRETTFENIGNDEDENTSEVEQYVDNLGVETSLEAQLQEINDALVKIPLGTYGICEETGEVISEDRLRAYPQARTVIR